MLSMTPTSHRRCAQWSPLSPLSFCAQVRLMRYAPQSLSKRQITKDSRGSSVYCLGTLATQRTFWTLHSSPSDQAMSARRRAHRRVEARRSGYELVLRRVSFWCSVSGRKGPRITSCSEPAPAPGTNRDSQIRCILALRGGLWPWLGARDSAAIRLANYSRSSAGLFPAGVMGLVGGTGLEPVTPAVCKQCGVTHNPVNCKENQGFSTTVVLEN
jgi:hypothetical protein